MNRLHVEPEAPMQPIRPETSRLGSPNPPEEKLGELRLLPGSFLTGLYPERNLSTVKWMCSVEATGIVDVNSCSKLHFMVKFCRVCEGNSSRICLVQNH